MERRIESRLSIHLPGTFRVEDGPASGMFFSQLSSKGCRIVAEESGLQVGATVEVFLGPVGPNSAQVRWMQGDAAGVEFDTALDAAIVSYFSAFINDAA